MSSPKDEALDETKQKQDIPDMVYSPDPFKLQAGNGHHPPQNYLLLKEFIIAYPDRTQNLIAGRPKPYPLDFDSVSQFKTNSRHIIKRLDKKSPIVKILLQYAKHLTNPTIHLWLGRFHHLNYQKRKLKQESQQELLPILEFALNEYQGAATLGNIEALCLVAVCLEEIVSLNVQACDVKQLSEIETQIEDYYEHASDAGLCFGQYRLALFLKRKIKKINDTLAQKKSKEKDSKEIIELEEQIDFLRTKFFQLLELASKKSDSPIIKSQTTIPHVIPFTEYYETDVHFQIALYYLKDPSLYPLGHPSYVQDTTYLNDSENIIKHLANAKKLGHAEARLTLIKFRLNLAEYYLRNNRKSDARERLAKIVKENIGEPYQSHAHYLYGLSYKIKIINLIKSYSTKVKVNAEPLELMTAQETINFYQTSALQGDFQSQYLLAMLFYQLGTSRLKDLQDRIKPTPLQDFVNELTEDKDHFVIPQHYEPENTKTLGLPIQNTSLVTLHFHFQTIFEDFKKAVYWLRILAKHNLDVQTYLEDIHTQLGPLMEKYSKQVNHLRKRIGSSFEIPEEPSVITPTSSENTQPRNIRRYVDILKILNPIHQLPCDKILSHIPNPVQRDPSFKIDGRIPYFTRFDGFFVFHELIDNIRNALPLLLCIIRYRSVSIEISKDHPVRTNPFIKILMSKDIRNKVLQFLTGYHCVSLFKDVELCDRKNALLNKDNSPKLLGEGEAIKDAKPSEPSDKELKEPKELDELSKELTKFPKPCETIMSSLWPFNYIRNDVATNIKNEWVLNSEYLAIYRNIDDAKSAFEKADFAVHPYAQYELAKILHHKSITFLVSTLKRNTEISEFTNALFYGENSTLFFKEKAKTLLNVNNEFSTELSRKLGDRIHDLRRALTYYQKSNMLGLAVQSWVIPSLINILKPMLDNESQLFRADPIQANEASKKLLPIFEKLAEPDNLNINGADVQTNSLYEQNEQIKLKQKLLKEAFEIVKNYYILSLEVSLNELNDFITRIIFEKYEEFRRCLPIVLKTEESPEMKEIKEAKEGKENDGNAVGANTSSTAPVVFVSASDESPAPFTPGFREYEQGENHPLRLMTLNSNSRYKAPGKGLSLS